MMINEEDPVREYHKQHECVHFLLNPESINDEIGLELRKQMPEKLTNNKSKKYSKLWLQEYIMHLSKNVQNTQNKEINWFTPPHKMFPKWQLVPYFVDT